MRNILIFLSLVALPALAQNEMTAKAWLENMSQALQHQGYKASMVQVQAGHIRPLVYLHDKVDNKEVAFLEYLNGPPQKAVRIDNTVTFIEHDQTPYSIFSNRIEGLWPAAFTSNLGILSHSYQFVLGGRARIAGRPGQLVRIISKDNNRFSYRVWLDMDNFLPLRMDTVSVDKNLLQQLMVVEIGQFDTTPEILQEAIKRQWPSARVISPQKQTYHWKFTWLPKGFKVRTRDHHRLYGSREPVEYIGLTDGLANISVYISESKTTELPSELTSQNGMAIVTDRIGDAEVVVVGQAPSKTLIEIAKSLRLEN
ncbi:MucB/RseB [Parashewanella curva]|uniref:MucB/RseB n=1 Tax=Parashewanella curva TaxID=2338552 RepID=A0A3L8PRA5_9GAMM|nr:MucB/RseB C-terminal domain-containing protein [Parashewanella curva]RLV57917.1 MucB/RseB [Parashewanella curva]